MTRVLSVITTLSMFVYHVILKTMQDGEGSYLRVLVDMFSTVPDESNGLHAGVRK